MIQPVRLAELCSLYGLQLDSSTIVEHIYHSSKDVTTDSVFVALAGSTTHGASFAREAIANGASLIITDSAGAALIETKIPVITVVDPRLELANLAKIIYGPHIADMHLWGITGTNGKTTTSYMLRALLPQPAAAIGTTGVVYNSSREELARTTPEIDDLYRLLIKLRKAEIKKVVLEVSSHALVLKRIHGLHFQAVAFTNLSQDHLDFHQTMDNYLQAKSLLFSLEFSKYAVVCIDSPEGVLIADLAEANGLVVSTISTKDQMGTWSISESMVGVDAIEGVINPIGLKLNLKLGGRFNFSNALLAIAMADQVSEISAVQLVALAQLEVPGRMQSVKFNGVQAIVDYAHSPAAIEFVCSELADCVSGRLIVVLGAGGNRDASKRSLMGAALRNADHVVVTDDNPRDEDPAQIRRQIISGIEEIAVPYTEVPDRRAAINAAVALVNSSNDLVAVLGKGHERGQQIKDQYLDFDDVTEIRHAIENRANHG
jgi:UDP-N-acetylmuramoyl-L-alanyl-D-glutamate--2,6-diaminopimelate ligase